MENTKINKCYVCGSKDFFQRNGEVRDDSSIKILECNQCGLVFLDTQKTNEAFYENNQMHNQADVYELTQRRNMILDGYAFNKKRLEFLFDGIVGKDLLDFGSGHAGFLLQAKKYVNSLAGVELESQVESIYKENNIPLYRSLDEINENIGGGGGIPNNQNLNKYSIIKNQDSRINKFDVITSFHVLEHLSDPVSMLKKLATFLKPNGKIIIEVPHSNDALLSIYENEAFQKFTYWSPHLYLFNHNTLKMLAKQANLTIDFIKGIQRYPISNTLYWLAKNKPAGQKIWGGFLDNPILQKAYEDTLASLNATDTLIAQFRA